MFFFRNSPIVPKKVSASETSQSEISYENVGVPYDQVKVSERRKAKKTEEWYFQQSLRKLISSTESKSNKEVNLNSRETYFFSRKSSKKLR